MIGSRRRWWAVALAVALAGMVFAVPSAAAGRGATTRLDLPAPTGAHPVGTTSLHLVDSSRLDPLAPTTRLRELMVRLWYPAAWSRRQPVAGYLTPALAGVLTQQLNALLGTDHPADLLTFPTHSRLDAPASTGSRRPVLLFSPGMGMNAALYTAITEELASRGYVVAGIDHTFDAPAVEFPGGRIELQNPDALVDPDRLRAVRAADVRFVLDQLAELPGGLGRALDLTRIGAFGHSLGSRSAVDAIETDRRFDAGAALDGNPLGPASLDRPFLLLGNQTHRRVDDPDWADFYDRLRGPRLHMVVDGALHHDLSDIAAFKEVIDFGPVFEVGPIDGHRALTINRRYLTAWFDQALLGRPSGLLCSESPRFPEVDFQP